MTTLIRDQVRDRIAAALDAAQASGALPKVAAAEIAVERPQRPDHGDYATNLPLRMASTMGRKPLEVAEAIAAQIPPDGTIAAVEVATPGFINLRLAPAWKAKQVEAILAEGAAFGALNVGAGTRLQVEFVSANPTGPLQVGNGRGAVLGDVLANVLAAAGYDVQREYYVNDAGTQVRVFAETLYARYLQALGRDATLPEEGYQGQYMVQVAQRIAQEEGEAYVQPDGQGPPDALAARGLTLMVESIQEALRLLGVHFDAWFRESALLAPNDALDGRSAYDVAIARLREGGFIAEKDDAIWFASTKLGEDKDNVLVRRTGEPTYFATDVAYHFDKFVVRGFDRVIDIWGADHHGHVSRMKTAAEAVGGPEGGLEILLYQLVHLRRGEERVRMSKRTGEIVTLPELIDDVGRDVTRFFLLQRSADSQMEFDLDLAVSQDPKQNPVYYVQYAHARCASILRSASEAGLDPASGAVSLLAAPEEMSLISAMLRLPELIEHMAATLEPHHLTTYAIELAQEFTQFYGACRVVDADAPELSAARLKLTQAAQTVLARTLGLIGVDAPETM